MNIAYNIMLGMGGIVATYNIYRTFDITKDAVYKVLKCNSYKQYPKNVRSIYNE